MLNLLIREDRHWLRKEYLLRFTLVFILFLISSLLIWGVVIASFYTQLKVEQNIANEELQNIKNSSDSKNLEELSNLNKKLKNKFNEISIYNFNQQDLLREVVVNNREGININIISINIVGQEKDFVSNIEIRGFAESRSALVEYQESLETSEIFAEVKIPFSSFAQNANIPFTVNIKTVALNEYFEKQNEN